MKKLFAFAISTMMLLSFAMPVFAGNTIVGNGTATLTSPADIPVNVQVVRNEGDVYKVDITWESLDFKYTYGASWNTTLHTYSESGSWSHQDSKITVTNHSNRTVSVEAALVEDPSNKIDGVQLTFSGDNRTLPSAESWVDGTAHTASYNVNVAGNPYVDSTNKNVANVKITLN